MHWECCQVRFLEVRPPCAGRMVEAQQRLVVCGATARASDRSPSTLAHTYDYMKGLVRTMKRTVCVLCVRARMCVCMCAHAACVRTHMLHVRVLAGRTAPGIRRGAQPAPEPSNSRSRSASCMLMRSKLALGSALRIIMPPPGSSRTMGPVPGAPPPRGATGKIRGAGDGSCPCTTCKARAWRHHTEQCSAGLPGCHPCGATS